MVDARFKRKFQVAENLRVEGDYEGAFESYQDCLLLLDKRSAPRAYAVTSFRLVRAARRLNRVDFASAALLGLAEDEELPAEINVEAAESLVQLKMEYDTTSEVRVTVEFALSICLGKEAASARARLHGNLGVLALRDGDWSEARHNFLISADTFSQAGEPEGQAEAWTALGEVAVRMGRLDEAAGFYEDSFRLLVEHESFARAAVPRAAIGHLLRRRGQSREALEIFEEVCVVSLDGEGQVTGAFHDVALTHMDLGEWSSAEIALRRAQAHMTTRQEQAKVLYLRADWLGETGALSDALEAVNQAKQLFSAVNELRGSAAADSMANRLAWRLGRSPVEPVKISEIQGNPEVQLAYNAHMAERLFNADKMEDALTIARSIEESGSPNEDRVRQLKTDAYVDFLRWMVGEIDVDTFSQGALRISQDLYLTGNIRQAVGVALSPLPILAFQGASEHALVLMGHIRSMESEGWPLSWRRSLERTARILALAEGKAEVYEESWGTTEELTSRLVEQSLVAMGSHRNTEVEACLNQLESSGRSLWSRLIRSLF